MWDHETVPKSKYYPLPLRQEHQNSNHKRSASVFQQEHPHRRKHRPAISNFLKRQILNLIIKLLRQWLDGLGHIQTFVRSQPLHYSFFQRSIGSLVIRTVIFHSKQFSMRQCANVPRALHGGLPLGQISKLPHYFS